MKSGEKHLCTCQWIGLMLDSIRTEPQYALDIQKKKVSASEQVSNDCVFALSLYVLLFNF